MIRLWGRRTSGNVQKVLWCLEEIGLRYEQIDLGGPFGGNREPSYLALNPNGLVPTLEEDGNVVWESNTIVRYLAARYSAAQLWPLDSATRADSERWMDWALGSLSPMNVLFMGYVRTPEDQRNQAALSQALEQCITQWTILDRHLASRPFVAGDRLTVGDIPPGVQVWRWFNLPIQRPELPSLAAWARRLQERAGYRQHIATPLA
jgi:glutathione S-transferase